MSTESISRLLRSPLPELAEKILAALGPEWPRGVAAIQAYWAAFDSALWSNCRGKTTVAMVPSVVADVVARIEAAQPAARPSVLAVAAVLDVLALGYQSGDGLAQRDAASGVYFARYMPREGDHVIDAGAHCGFVSRMIAELVGITGALLAVEPHPRNFRVLSTYFRAAGYVNVVCKQVALGHEAGVATLLESGGSCSHRLSTRVLPLGIEVPVVTVDSLGLERLDFAKIDVEGSEHRVVRGMLETVKRCRPHMAIEFEGVERFQEISDMLLPLDYELSHHFADGDVGFMYATPMEKRGT